ncbi:MAG: SGNH family hydrolase [Bauldia sp.]
MAGRVAVMLGVAAALVAVVPTGSGLAQPRPPGAIGQPAPPPPPPPQAQRRGFLQFLFGPREPGPLGPPATTGKRPGAAPPVATVEVVAKDPTATKIMVIGDFVAGGLAWGLDQMFADEAKIAVIDRSNSNSGLVRNDYYDWNKELPQILNDGGPEVVVMVIGANDRQQMRDGKARLPPRSEGWDKAYIQRVEGIVDTLRVYGRPFFWVSAPPMQSSSASRDMAYLNELYKPRVTTAGGHFVDIWNGFTNEDGRYVSSGPDVDGQLRALRSGDGINFTRAGRLKLAFYVEREIRRDTGIGSGAIDLLASASQASQIEIGPDGIKRLVGPVISLSDPLPGASAVLAGEIGPTGYEVFGLEPEARPLLSVPADAESLQYLLVIKGAGLPGVAGRADDYSWPLRRRAVAGGREALTGAAQPLPADLTSGEATN